ncbi:hypothetical protein, partial [Streptobacillus moniliformis]|uniref:hypothetical protein n=1 Tax=Streptobacillus moniliformis TaxID=34105 RepID=UPI0018C86F8E
LALSPYSVALMDFEATPLVELYGRTVSGSGTRSATWSAFGTYSGQGNGTTTQVVISNVTLGNDFTIEFDFMMPALPTVGYYPCIMPIGDTLDGADGFHIAINSTGTVVFGDAY